MSIADAPDLRLMAESLTEEPNAIKHRCSSDACPPNEMARHLLIMMGHLQPSKQMSFWVPPPSRPRSASVNQGRSTRQLQQR